MRVATLLCLVIIAMMAASGGNAAAFVAPAPWGPVVEAAL